VLASGALDVRTDKLGADTLFARIITLVEDAEAHQAPVQELADRVAAWLIPLVLVFLVGVWLVTRDIRTVVTLMIITSPAELGLATPLVMIAAVARAARNGILIKGGLYLKLLAKVDLVVFDKTGTLTANRPAVARVETQAGGLDERELMRLAAAADRRSAHPLAQAVVAHAAALGIEVLEPQQYEQIQARGVRGTVEGRVVLVGNPALLAEAGVAVPAATDPAGAGSSTPVHGVVDGRFVGIAHIADAARPGARKALAARRRPAASSAP